MRRHQNPENFIDSTREIQARARYDTLSKIMEGDVSDAAYAEAVAAHAYERDVRSMCGRC